MGPENPPFEDVSSSDALRFRVIRNVITPEEAEQLSLFILSKLNSEGEIETTSTYLDLQYRPDEWDASGVIDKIYNFGKEYLKEQYSLEGGLEPKTFRIIRTDGYQTYKEVFPESPRDKTYSLISTPMFKIDGAMSSGATLYEVNGEGFIPNATSLIVQKNISLNNWEVTETAGGIRLDLVVVFREFRQGMSYNYEIEQTIDDGVYY
jgi:hypothetical protein